MLGPAFGRDAFLRLAEIGLVLLLFTDASRTDLKVLRNIRNLPTRLLSAGMLLTIVLGALAARLVFPHLSIWEAGILAAILAPTDAGLGQVIVNSPRVPLRIRQALNVEAGLNDGLSVPFLLFFIALAAAGSEGGTASLMRFIVEQLGLGVAGRCRDRARRRMAAGPRRRGKEWMADSFRAGRRGGAAAAMPAGVRNGRARACSLRRSSPAWRCRSASGTPSKHSVEFAEEWGQLLNLSVFFLFGLLVARNWQQIDPPSVLYAVLSLTVVRMLPVAIALIGTRLSRPTVIFMGWFGPRGLASIVLGLVYLRAGSAICRASRPSDLPSWRPCCSASSPTD